MSNKSLTFTRSDFLNFSSQTFCDIYESDTFSDVTLVSKDGKLLKGHKLILSSASSVFKKLLTSSEKITDISVDYAQLSLLVRFIYTGKCKVEPSNLPLFLSAATFLQIKGLIPETSANYGEKDRFNQSCDSKFLNLLDDSEVSKKLKQFKVPDTTTHSLRVSKYKLNSLNADNSISDEVPHDSKEAHSDSDCKTQSLACVDKIEKDFTNPTEVHDTYRDNIIDQSNSTLETKSVEESISINKYEPVSTEICLSSTKTADNLNQRSPKSQSEEHNIRNYSNYISFPCAKCDKKFTNSSHLRRHMRMNHGSLYCKKCMKTFTVVRLLREHEVIHMEGTTLESSSFYCHYCYARQFRTAQGLENHLKVHNGERLDCRNCHAVSMTFKEIAFHHQSDHIETLKYRCEKCDFRTHSTHILRKHTANLHNGSAKSCSVDGCDYSCMFLTILKEYKCDIESCNYKSTIKSDLKTHTDNIHLKIRHTCEYCGLQLTTRSNLIQHKSIVHMNKSGIRSYERVQPISTRTISLVVKKPKLK